MRLHGFLPHDETVALLLTGDLLFLPMHDLPVGRRVSIVPCKTYDYFAAGRPILAAVPDGDVRDLLTAAGNAHICRPRDVAGLRAAIERELEAREAGEPPRPPDPDVVARVSPVRLTEELVAVLDAAAGARVDPLRPARTASSLRL